MEPTQTIHTVNLAEKFQRFQEMWSPKVVADLNDCHVKLVKIAGEFVWHQHENEDELFLVIKGSLIMYLRDRALVVNEGEFVVVPKGVVHKPVAESEAHLLLIEPKTTINTGNVQSERTVIELERI